MDLSSSADDLTSAGLPGYLGLRVSCAAADAASLASVMNGAPLVVPVNSSGYPTPAQGNASASTPSDPLQVYALVVWVAGDLPPSLGGDGQPLWPSSTVPDTNSTGVNSGAASSALIGVVSGLPIGGF